MLFVIVYRLPSFLSYLTFVVFFFFLLVSVVFLCAFLNFCAVALVELLLLYKDAVFPLSRFFLAASVSHGTLCMAPTLAGVHAAAAAM